MGAWLSSLATNAWDQDIVAPTLGQPAQLPGSAPETLHIAPQPPDPSATNATNGTPGNLEIDFAAPVTGGAYPGTFAKVGGTPLWSVEVMGTGAMLRLGNLAGTVYDAVISNVGPQLTFLSGSSGMLFSSTGVGGNLFVLNPSGAGYSLDIANSSQVAAEAGYGRLQSIAGAGTWCGSSGTITTFGPAEPHCPVCGKDFVTEHYNEKYGYLSVCLSCLADHLGEQPYLIRDRAHRTEKISRKHPGKGMLVHSAHRAALAYAVAAATLATLLSHFWR